MTRSITKSVGKAAVNLPADVQAVQALLNQVPLNEGAPPAALMVDGLCGPKTSEAIRKFQVRQFGAAGADGRVDPNGRTLARLNDFEADAPPLLTTTSVLRCPHGAPVKSTPAGPGAYNSSPVGVPLKTTDPHVVTGCLFPTPCVRVKWVGAIGQTLNITTPGLCVNAAGIPQGPVVISSV